MPLRHGTSIEASPSVPDSCRWDHGPKTRRQKGLKHSCEYGSEGKETEAYVDDAGGVAEAMAGDVVGEDEAAAVAIADAWILPERHRLQRQDS